MRKSDQCLKGHKLPSFGNPCGSFVVCARDLDLAGKFPFPEYRAIPFYRAGDDQRAFEMTTNSFLHIPLLGEMTGSMAARLKFVDRAKQMKMIADKGNARQTPGVAATLGP